MNNIIPIESPNPAELFKPGGLAEILDSIEKDALSIASGSFQHLTVVYV